VSSRSKVSTAPMAIASDGAVLVNAVEFVNDLTPEALVRFAKGTGATVFVGIVVPRGLGDRLQRDLRDAAADIVGRLGPLLVRRTSART
jgi:hypothetical protein